MPSVLKGEERMLKLKPGKGSRNYWQAIVAACYEDGSVRQMDEVVVSSTRVNKQQEAIMCQLLAEARGLA